MTYARALAAAQTIPVPGDVDANIEQHVRLARAAAGEHARVVVFPELSLTGYELDLADALAFGERDPRLDPLRAVAASSRVTLVVGAPVRLEDRLHIGAFILSSDGSTRLYTKHHLGAGEEAVVQPGSRNPSVRIGHAPAAVAICADANWPAHPAQAAESGARTYLLGSFIVPPDLEGKAATLRSYAVRHSMAVVFANYGGPSGGMDAAGRSAIWSEKGKTLVQLDRSGAGLAVAIETDAGWQADAVALEGV